MFKTHFLASASLSDGNRDTKDGVGTELTLVGCTVKLDEEVVNILLLGDLEAGLDKLGGDDFVDVCNSLWIHLETLTNE
jgi:hypothetical protein